MTQARAQGRPMPAVPALLRPQGHEPTIFERLELAGDALTIAHFAARTGRDLALAGREVARARSEVGSVARSLETARAQSQFREGAARPEIVNLLDLSRQIEEELFSVSARISRSR